MSTELDKQAREQMRQIWRNSGHNFSEADIEKLCDDADEEIKQWAAFASQVREQSIAECAKAMCYRCEDLTEWHPVKRSGEWWTHDWKAKERIIEPCMADQIWDIAAPPQTTEQERG